MQSGDLLLTSMGMTVGAALLVILYREVRMQNRVRVKNRDGWNLIGDLHMPRQAPVAYALFAHCFTCTRNVRAAVHIARELADTGVAVLRFDFTGLGDSDGDFSDTHFSSNVSDLVDVAKWMADRGQAPQLLIGHSLGGTAVLAAADEIKSAVAVATLGSPADADHVLKLVEDHIEVIEDVGEARVHLAGRPFFVKKAFLDNVRRQSVRERLGQLQKALLVMHSPTDELVSIDEAGRIFAAAKHPKSFVSIDGADHLLTRQRDARFVGRMLSAWASRYFLNTPSER